MEFKQFAPYQESMLGEIISHVNAIMALIDKYEANRPGSIAFTKLEEAVLWTQVMIGNAKLKPVYPQGTDGELKDAEIVAEIVDTEK